MRNIFLFLHEKINSLSMPQIFTEKNITNKIKYLLNNENESTILIFLNLIVLMKICLEYYSVDIRPHVISDIADNHLVSILKKIFNNNEINQQKNFNEIEKIVVCKIINNKMNEFCEFNIKPLQNNINVMHIVDYMTFDIKYINYKTTIVEYSKIIEQIGDHVFESKTDKPKKCCILM